MDKPKLTDKQWEVLERVKLSEQFMPRTDSGSLDPAACDWLFQNAMIAGSDYGTFGSVSSFVTTPAGRAALAARRAEREGKAQDASR